MKITTQQIKQIISEEIDVVLKKYIDIDGDDWWDEPDVDYLSAKSGPVVFFHKSQQYNIQGRTHGMFSHFLKHANKLGMKDTTPQIVLLFKQAIEEAINQNYDLYYYDGTDSYPLTLEMLNNMNNRQLSKVARITLDRINDDVLNKIPVSEIERDFHAYAKEFLIQYKGMAEEIIMNPDAYAVSEEDPKKVVFVKGNKVVVLYDGKIATVYADRRCSRNPQACAIKAAIKR
jgi:hypothetical protein